jgi:hypothetical protein
VCLFKDIRDRGSFRKWGYLSLSVLFWLPVRWILVLTACCGTQPVSICTFVPVKQVNCVPEPGPAPCDHLNAVPFADAQAPEGPHFATGGYCYYCYHQFVTRGSVRDSSSGVSICTFCTTKASTSIHIERMRKLMELARTDASSSGVSICTFVLLKQVLLSTCYHQHANSHQSPRRPPLQVARHCCATASQHLFSGTSKASCDCRELASVSASPPTAVSIFLWY